MSNNKLYTEEQVKKMLDLARFTYNSEDKILLSQIPIQLPSDEEIREWAEMQSLGEPTGAEEFGRIYGAKWMRDLVQGGSK
jgi:hypothetical protein